MSGRRVKGLVGLLVGAPGVWWIFTQSPSPVYTSLPDWGWEFMGLLAWAWFVLSFIGLTCMVFEIKTKVFAMASVISFAVIIAIALIDVIITDSPPSDLSFVGFLALCGLYIGWNAFNLSELDSTNTAPELRPN